MLVILMVMKAERDIVIYVLLKFLKVGRGQGQILKISMKGYGSVQS